MPFDPSAPLPGGRVGVSTYDKPEPSYIETVGAWMRQDGLIGSAITSARRGVDDFNRIDPAYNPFDDIKGYEKYADRFEGSYNPQASAAIKSDIDRELKDREIQASSGWVATGLGMVAALGTDPTILLPGGALIKAGRVGYRAGRTAASVGVASGVATAAQEAGLQATQEIRPGMESAVAIGGSALLGGLVGAAGAKFFSKGEWDSFSRSLKDDLRADVPNSDELVETIVARAQSAGAASVDNLKLDDLGVGGPRLAQAVARATAAAKINPGIQTMLSSSKKVREVYTKLVDNPIYSKMNMEGNTLGSDVENLVKAHQRGALSQWIKAGRASFREAKDAGWVGTKSDFYVAVAKAGRRGDVDPNGNEFVTRAAQEARAKVFDPLLKRAKDNGQLPEDVKVETAQTYVTRLWNRQALIGRENEFREIARDYFRKEMGKLPSDKKLDFINEADLKDYIEDVVSSVFRNLTGKGAGDVPDWLVPVKRGPLKERTFKIPDALIEDFLENDMEMIMRRYTRIMGAEVELATKFGRADMKDQFDEIAKDYEALRQAAKTPAEREKLTLDEVRDTKNLQAFRDMIRGTYRAAEESSEWSVLTRAALALNYMRLLGGVAITSLTDIARIPAVYGIKAAMTKTLPALISNTKAANIARGDARDMGVISETVLQTRIASLADLNDPYAYGSKFERMMSNATNVFSKATGLSWLNDTTKTIASVMTQNRILKNAVRGFDGLDAREKAYMAYLGIDQGTANTIAEQFARHGAEEKGIFGANVSRWGSELDTANPEDFATKVVRRRVEAIARDVEFTVGDTTYANPRLLIVDLERTTQEQAKREGLLSDPSKVAAYAEEKGISVEEMDVLLRSNYAANAPRLEELKRVAASEEFRAAQSSANQRTAGFKFTDLTDETIGTRPAAPIAETGATSDAPSGTADEVVGGMSGADGVAAKRREIELARRAYGAALAKDVDRTIVTKGVADTPLWMKTNWGKALFQFKSFALASHQRVLIAGLQERPERLATMLVMGTAIGMMIDYFKFLERGDTEGAQRLLDNPGLWVAGGLDRTGILAIAFEISNTGENFGAPFGITTAMQTLAGDEDVGGPSARYASRNKLGAVLGPSAGLFQDLATIAEQLADQGSEGKGLQKSGANAIIRMIPGASLPGVRTAIHVGIKPALVDAVD